MNSDRRNGGDEVTGRGIPDLLRVEDALESSVNPIALADLDGNLVYVNQAFVKAWGHESDAEIVGRCATEFWLDMEKAERVLGAIQAGGNKIERLRARRRDGTIFEVLAVAHLVAGRDGAPSALMGSFLDMTDLDAARRELAERTEHLQAVYDGIVDGLAVVDIETRRVVTANTSLCRMSGYSLSEILSMDPDSAHPPGSLAEVIGQFRRLAGGEIEYAEIPFLKKDGSVMHAEVGARAIRYQGRECLVCFLRDISKDLLSRQETEGRLSFLQTLMDTIPSPIFHKDLEGRYQGCNQAFGEWVGKSPREVVGKTVAEVHPEELAAIYRQKDRELMASGGKQVYESMVRRADGTDRDVIFNKATFQDLGGGVAGIVGAYVDITEQKQIGRALRESEELFRMAAELATDQIYEVRADTLRFNWFGDIDAMLGYEQGRFPRDLKATNEHIHPEDRDRVLKAVAACILERAPFEEEYRLRHKDGHYLDILSRGMCQFDDGGNIVRWVGVNSNVTDKRRSEGALREHLDELQAIYDGMVDGLLVVDPASKRFLRTNPAMSAMTGYTEDELLSMAVMDIHPPGQLDRVLDYFERQVLGEIDKAPDIPILRKDGSVLIADVRTRLLEYDGKPSMMGVFRDITERMEAENELRRRESILEAVAHAAQTLLNSESWEDKAGDILARLGRATGVSRAYIFQNFTRDGDLRCRQLFEWVNDGIAPELDNPLLQDFSYAGHDLSDWVRVFERGEPIAASRDEAGGPLGDVFDSQGILSLLIVPVFQAGQWWGYIGFDECAFDRKWSEAEIDILRAAAGNLGAAIHRQEAGRRLRDSETKYRLIAENAADVIWTTDMEWNLTYISPSAEQLFGYPLTELFKLSPSHVLDDETLSKVAESFAEMADLEEMAEKPWHRPFTLELPMRRRHGQRFWTEVNWSFLRDNDGGLVGMQGVMRDVTQKKKAETELQESEAKWRSLVENAANIIMTADLGGVVVFVNRPPSGFSAEEMVGRPFHDFLDPGGRDLALRCVEKAIDSGEAQTYETGGLAPLDSSWYAVQVGTLMDGDRAAGLTIIATDITDRKRMEEALKQSEEYARIQFDSIPVPTYTWRRAGKDFELVNYNDSAKKVTRGRISEYIGIKANDFYRDDPVILGDMHECFTRESSLEREMRYYYRSLGEYRYINVKYAYAPPELLLVHTEDITEKRKAEEALAESQKKHRQTLAAEVRRRRQKDYSSIKPQGSEMDPRIFSSPAMRKAMEDARLAARSDGNLCILGKSGAGKTYLAGWIHQNSNRAEGPFFDINCAALAASLIESELFGHEAGAFTGSQGRKRGLLELADGGTLFLDEIGDMPMNLQAKLLNFLDTRLLMRIGGEQKIRVDARIIAATNRDLDAQVRSGKFRQDLYYRLNVLTIMVPPLSERKEDISVLAAEIMASLAGEMGFKEPPTLSPEAIKQLTEYDWPGNVRELRNVLEREMLRSIDSRVIANISLIAENTAGTAPEAKSSYVSDNMLPFGEGDNFDDVVEGLKKRLIEEALAKSSTKIEAAELLGISRHALNRYVRKYLTGDR